MFEGEAGFPRGSHATAHTTNTCQPLTNIGPWSPLLRSANKVELRGDTVGPRLTSPHKRMLGILLMLLLLLEQMLLLLLLLLVLLSTGSNLGILFRKNADGACGDFMVDDGLVVFADDVDTEFLGSCEGEVHILGLNAYHDVVAFQFVRLGLDALGAESLAVDKGAVGAFDVLDVDLLCCQHRRICAVLRAGYLASILPDLSVLPAEDFRVKKAVLLAGSSLWVCLPSDFDALASDEGYVFWNERVIQRVEVEGRIWLLGMLGSVGGRWRHCGRRRQRRAGALLHDTIT